jgi:hypothetical protein
MTNTNVNRRNRRKLDLRSIDAALREVERLHTGGWRRVGQWSLAQACDHLTTSVRYSLEGFPGKGNWAIKFFLGPVLRWNYLRTRHIPAGFPTHPDAAPRPELDETESVERFRQWMEKLRAHPGPFCPHPFFGHFKPKDWIEYHLIHASHHLSFLWAEDRMVV